MKTIALFLALMGSQLAVASDACRPIESVLVSPATFAEVDLQVAIGRLLDKTGYELEYSVKGLRRMVRADSVSGPLSVVLNALAKDAPIAWWQNGCKIVVAASAKQSEAETANNIDSAAKSFTSQAWSVSVNDRTIRRAITRWGEQAGYSVVWGVEMDITIDSDGSFTGSFEDAVGWLLETIVDSQYPVEAVIYENKVVRIVKTTRTEFADRTTK